jgi:hypothetical protein
MQGNVEPDGADTTTAATNATTAAATSATTTATTTATANATAAATITATAAAVTTTVAVTATATATITATTAAATTVVTKPPVAPSLRRAASVDSIFTGGSLSPPPELPPSNDKLTSAELEKVLSRPFFDILREYEAEKSVSNRGLIISNVSP